MININPRPGWPLSKVKPASRVKPPARGSKRPQYRCHPRRQSQLQQAKVRTARLHQAWQSHSLSWVPPGQGLVRTGKKKHNRPELNAAYGSLSNWIEGTLSYVADVFLFPAHQIWDLWPQSCPDTDSRKSLLWIQPNFDSQVTIETPETTQILFIYWMFIYFLNNLLGNSQIIED